MLALPVPPERFLDQNSFYSCEDYEERLAIAGVDGQQSSLQAERIDGMDPSTLNHYI